MGIFDLSIITQEEILCFFAVLVRYSVLIAVMPFVGDKAIPMPAKVLLSVAITTALFPALISRGQIHPGEAAVWGATTSGIAGTIGAEVLFALVMGYTAKMIFESISFGTNLIGNFMGFAQASTYDPHQESQTQVVAQLHMAIAMLIFLAIDGHHLMLRASLDSYRIVGLGKASLNGLTSQRLIEFSAQVVRFAIQLSAPVAIALFAVNVGFGILGKALPQLNIFALSGAVSAFIGLLVMFMSVPEFQGAVGAITGRMGEWMETMALAMVGR